MVKQFNERLNSWREATSCTANFSWKYNQAGEKVLVISEIDLAIYRSEGPNAKNLQDVISQYQAE